MNLQRQGYEPMYCGKTYLARVVGIINCGRQPQGYHRWFHKEYLARPECIVAFEFLDQDLNIADKKPLVLYKSMAYSSHPKSKLTKLLNDINPKLREEASEYQDEDGQWISVDSKFDIEGILYGLVEIRVRESCKWKGLFMISDIYKANDAANVVYREATLTTPYFYDIPSQSFTHGFVKDFEEMGMIDHFVMREER